jgi:hypothetical protein
MAGMVPDWLFAPIAPPSLLLFKTGLGYQRPQAQAGRRHAASCEALANSSSFSNHALSAPRFPFRTNQHEDFLDHEEALNNYLNTAHSIGGKKHSLALAGGWS